MGIYKYTAQYDYPIQFHVIYFKICEIRNITIWEFMVFHFVL